MNIFEAYAILQFGTIAIAIIIIIWRGAVRVKDIVVEYTKKGADWASRRKGGL